MKIKFVFGILPVFIFENVDLGKYDGKALGPIIRLGPRAKSEVLPHELVHAKQDYLGIILGLVFIALSYFFNAFFLLGVPAVYIIGKMTYIEFRREAAAYAEQARYLVENEGLTEGEAMRRSAERLSDKTYYDLPFSYENALEMITSFYYSKAII